MDETFIFDAIEELHKIQAQPDKNQISTISRISNASTANQNFSDKNKRDEIKKLIGNYARHWGETEENIEEYIQDQLAVFPLDDLIKCFRSLNADIQNLQRPLANVANSANQQRSS